MIEYFKKGINVGGWLSQYDFSEKGILTYEQRMEHFKSFITIRDVEQIAKWGADHIRLPINGELLLEENSEEYFYYIDKCIQWCEDFGINIILDIHQIEGHEYGQMQKVIPLLKEEKLQQRLIEVWRKIAYRYATKQKPAIMFELLNEISDASKGYLWNRLYKEIIKEIRSIDKNHYILVGSNDQNSVLELKSLELINDDKIVYNFHFYDPQIFTHQKAHFSEDMMKYNCKVHYPDTINDFVDFLCDNPKYLDKYRWFALEKDINKTLLKKVLVDAKTFCQYSGCNLYCSEFGVINNADLNDINAFAKDVVELFGEYGIGYAYWNYKEMDYGIVDKNNCVLNQKLISTLFE